MAQVTITIGDRSHIVGCADGDEPRLARLGAMLDARWADAKRAAGSGGSERVLLLIALMLADSLDEAHLAPPVATPEDDAAMIALAERLERLADALEDAPPSA